MYHITIHDNTQTIRVDRTPTFLTSIETNYEKFIADPELMNSLTSHLSEHKNAVAHDLYGFSDVQALLQSSLDAQAPALETRIGTPYTATISIKDKEVFSYITKSYNDDILWENYLSSGDLNPVFVRNILATRVHAIKLLNQQADKDLTTKTINDVQLIEYITANIDSISYSENPVAQSYTSLYLEFLCLLYPDRLYMVYDSASDDIIICDPQNLAYALETLPWKLIILTPKEVYDHDILFVQELRKQYWRSIIDKVLDMCWWLLADDSIAKFEIQKKRDNIIIKKTSIWNYADSTSKRIWEYGELHMKKHNQNKVTEVTITEKMAKKDYLEIKL